jgi:hypothetical protein
MSFAPSFCHPPPGFWIAALASCVWACGTQADDRLLVEATINGKPVHLAFDTGAGALILVPQTVARLGLAYTNAPKDARVQPGEVPMGITEECDLRLSCSPGRTVRTRFRVMEFPSVLALEMDGLIGWASVRDDNEILMIDARQRIVSALTSIPGDITNWTKFKILRKSDVLRLQTLEHSKPPSIILVDTGDDRGVALAPDRWRQWKAVHTNQPLTLVAYYTPAAGLVVAEESWAQSLPIGGLLLKDVPVKEADKADIASGSVTLGLAALRCVDLVVHAKEGFAYLRRKEVGPPPYEHNRLGAVFTPVDLESQDLIARVVRGSPGWEAGIRDGDVLIRIGDLDVTKWHTDPTVLPLGRFWSRAAGTKLDLTLRRGNQVFRSEAILRQILPPEKSVSGKVPHE